MPGALVLVATPIGNLEDITLRGLRVLREADLIAAEDTRRTAKLLSHFGIATPTVSLHQHNERRRVPDLLERVKQGQRVAVVTDAGMPSVSDPGYAIVSAGLTAGIPVEIVPGVSALTAALTGAGLPTEAVIFLGFPPSKAGERARWLARWSSVPGVLVLFEGPHRLHATLRAAFEALGDRPAVVAHELTKVHESWHRAALSTLVDEDLPKKGEFTILIGPRDEAVDATQAPQSTQVGTEFGQMIENDGFSRKEAIAELARRHGLRKREIYAMVEAAKYSGK